MKACPFCAEQIQDQAVKCRFCNEWLEGKRAIAEVPLPPPLPSPPPEHAFRTRACPSCGRTNPGGAVTCVFCRTSIADVEVVERSALEPEPSVPAASAPLKKSDVAAFFLGAFLGPVGLWYKRNWMAGFAWVVITLLLAWGTGGMSIPFTGIGMAIHAAMADTKE